MAASDTPSMSMTRLNEEMSWSSAAAKLENVFENAVGNPQALHMPADGDGTRPLNIAIATLGRYHVLDLARELDSLGHYVRFYSYVPKRRAIKFGLPEHCHVSLLPYLAPLLLFSRVCQRTRFAEFSQTVVHRAIDALVASRLMPCDIFIGMSGTFIKAPVTARKKFGAKVVVERGSTHIQTQQEILASVKLLNPHTKSIAPVNVVRELESYAIADKIAVPSLHAEQSFINHGFPANVMIRNPYGVDLTMFSPDSSVPRDSRLVLFVGGWCYRKGADILSAAMDTLSTQGFHLCHVGDVIDAPVPNASWFRSVGPVDQSELSIWYQRAGCLVQPSRQEGLSLVLIQALACGCPVVATTMTGASDLAAILPNSGMVHVVPVGDVDGLARAIAEGPVSCTDKASLEQLRSKLSWRAYAQRYVVELYRLIRQA
jgi:glycosyltransferase involved in cell wall biosynthesis